MAAIWCIGMIAVHLRDEFNPEHGLTILHKAIASTILFLVVLRMVWRATHPAPSLPSNISPAMRRFAEELGHLALYLFALVLLPLSGWFWNSVADKQIEVLYLFVLPPLVDPSPALYDIAGWTHAIIGLALGFALTSDNVIAYITSMIATVLAGMFVCGMLGQPQHSRRAGGNDRRLGGLGTSKYIDALGRQRRCWRPFPLQRQCSKNAALARPHRSSTLDSARRIGAQPAAPTNLIGSKQ